MQNVICIYAKQRKKENEHLTQLNKRVHNQFTNTGQKIHRQPPRRQKSKTRSTLLGQATLLEGQAYLQYIMPSYHKIKF